MTERTHSRRLRREASMLQALPQPRGGKLDRNAVQNGEVAREDQDAHQDEE